MNPPKKNVSVPPSGGTIENNYRKYISQNIDENKKNIRKKVLLDSDTIDMIQKAIQNASKPQTPSSVIRWCVRKALGNGRKAVLEKIRSCDFDIEVKTLEKKYWAQVLADMDEVKDAESTMELDKDER